MQVGKVGNRDNERNGIQELPEVQIVLNASLKVACLFKKLSYVLV